DVVGGKNVFIEHQVTIGAERRQSPRIGNGVFIGAGAKLIGDITIRDPSRAGANAGVLDDVPAYATVVGIPARVVRRRTASDFVEAAGWDMQLLYTSAFVVFWGCAAFIVYTYIVYPVLLVTLGALRRATAAPRELKEADLPSVSVLVVAHNEESVIRERIDNLLALDYPKDKLELVIRSDSSRDRTADLGDAHIGR